MCSLLLCLSSLPVGLHDQARLLLSIGELAREFDHLMSYLPQWLEHQEVKTKRSTLTLHLYSRNQFDMLGNSIVLKILNAVRRNMCMKRASCSTEFQEA